MCGEIKDTRWSWGHAHAEESILYTVYEVFQSDELRNWNEVWNEIFYINFLNTGIIIHK